MFGIDKITNHPNIEPIGKWLYSLEEDFDLIFSWNEATFRMRVYKGLEYDGASVPRWAWSIAGMRPDGLNRTAALIHDVIYFYKGILDDTCKYVDVFDEYGRRIDLVFNRKQADTMFLDILKASGVNKVRRNLQFAAVRIGGNKFWKLPRTKE